MHQPNVQPHESSYFQYQVYPFRRPADMDAGPPARHPVVIVGAGPIGLVLAIQLAANGVRPVLVEAEAQVCGGSRALALTRRTMEIFEQCGVAPRILRDAIVWSEGRSYYRNRVVHNLQIPAAEDDKFAPMTNLPQCDIEQILVDRALEVGVDLRFQTRLQAMAVADDKVCLTLDTPEGEYTVEADWVVGCDGARSAVRRLHNLRFEGRSYEGRFVIADFNIDMDHPPGRRCYFDPPWLPGHAVLMHKAPKGVWRLDYQVPDGVSDEEALDPGRISAHIRAHLAYIGVDRPWALEWTTVYKPNTLTLASYNHGRVLYCGDAAHLLPVFGVRGLNTGVQDSINLGWKLAAVVRGQAGPAILDTYSSERVADARQICVEAGRSTRLMVPPSRGYRVLRDAVLSLSLNHEFTRGLLHWRTSHPIDYATSPLSWNDGTEPSFAAGPGPGAPPRDARVQIEGRAAFLLDAFRPGFNVLVFGDDPQVWEAARADTLTARAEGLPVRLLAMRQDGSAAAGADADAVLHDRDGHAHRLWGAAGGAVYVLRPDQHVCARWKAGGRTRVADVLKHALGLREPALAA